MPLPLYTGREMEEFEGSRLDLDQHGRLCINCAMFQRLPGKTACWGCEVLNEDDLAGKRAIT
jgi:hypothetical protein